MTAKLEERPDRQSSRRGFQTMRGECYPKMHRYRPPTSVSSISPHSIVVQSHERLLILSMVQLLLSGNSQGFLPSHPLLPGANGHPPPPTSDIFLFRVFFSVKITRIYCPHPTGRLSTPSPRGAIDDTRRGISFRTGLSIHVAFSIRVRLEERARISRAHNGVSTPWEASVTWDASVSSPSPLHSMVFPSHGRLSTPGTVHFVSSGTVQVFVAFPPPFPGANGHTASPTFYLYLFLPGRRVYETSAALLTTPRWPTSHAQLAAPSTPHDAAPLHTPRRVGDSMFARSAWCKSARIAGADRSMLWGYL